METLEDNKYSIVPTEMRLNAYYYRIYCVWLNLLLMGLGPFLLLIILNALTLRELTLNAMSVQPNTLEDRQARRKNIVLSKVSLAIVFVFIVCHSIKWIPNIYELQNVSFVNCIVFMFPFVLLNSNKIALNTSVNS